MQKLYCYVDESGQDAGSKHFIVVAVVTFPDQETIRQKLFDIEKQAGTNNKKWHKLRHFNRIHYLTFVLERKVAAGHIYGAYYQKSIPYFFPMIDLLKKALKKTMYRSYRANIYVDGIDKRKAKALTNALRISGISLRLVRPRRDESEPLIRLADMWAGCLRSALLKHKDAQSIVKRAKEEGYLIEFTS